jgi:hypothetical protein
MTRLYESYGYLSYNSILNMNVFYEKLDIHIQNLNEKFHAKYIINKEIYKDIVWVLRDDPQFRY